MKNIFFFEVEKEDISFVQNRFPHAQIFSEAFDQESLGSCLKAEVLCAFVHSDLSAHNLEKLPNLKLIVTRSVGYDHIDLEYCKIKGIKVCNVPDYGSHVIAEHVFALLLSSLRHVLEGEERTEHDNFSWKGLRGMALKGKTLGVVGTGKIGMHVCRIASMGFQMKVLAYDIAPNLEKAKEYNFSYAKSLEDIWKYSDVITLHAPLSSQTEHMICENSIQKMKDGVVLINTSRGALIHTADLIEAIKSQKFSHVALDVIEHENNIQEDEELLHLPGVIITPHIAFYADDSLLKMYEESFEVIHEFLEGRVLEHEVNV